MFQKDDWVKKNVSSSFLIKIGKACTKFILVYREQHFFSQNLYSRYIPKAFGTLERTHFLLLLPITFYLLLSTKVSGQNADCDNLLLLKDTVYYAKNVNGFGNKQEFKGNELENELEFEEELHSRWYLLKMPAKGKLTFDIVAQDENDDWDFLLYEHKNLFCKRIDSNKIIPIRTNLSRSAITGLSITSTQKYSAAGLNDNYSQYVEVEKDDELVLVVNNPKRAGGNHKIILHLPQEIKIEEEVKAEPIPEKIEPSNLKKVIFEIKDSDTKKPLSVNMDITGLRNEVIELKDVAIYETEVSKQNYEVNIVISTKGYMLSAFDFKLFKNRSTENEVIYIEKIQEGKKVNLKNIQFYGERADFLPSASGALKSLLTFMQQNPTVNIEIEGHVNGPDQSNTRAFKKLSFDRANAVKKHLVEQGIESNRMQYIGYGNSQMLYPFPMKEEEHSANRRVEIKIISK